MIAHLSEEDRWKGVIACSAGNHAQGVAYSAKHLNIPATIVMPTPTPSIKYQNVARLGANVVLHGDDFDSAKAECSRLSEIYGLKNIPPFDDPFVIAGQGTIGLELLRQVDIQKLKAVFCGIGGGGLIAGIASYVKRIAPHVKIIGVETFDADAMYQSLKAGKLMTLSEVGLFADGAAVKVNGDEPFRLCKQYVDEVVRVSTDEICAAIKDVFEDTRSVIEPAGALSVAGLKRYIANHPDENHLNEAYVAILSGANMNFDRLRFVAERAKLGEGSEVFMIADIPERPGSFMSLINVINPRLVTEFSYRYADDKNPAHVYMSFSVQDRDTEVSMILENLEKEGMKGTDISDNEFAKSHARYLVGGKADVQDERIFSFEFPERPGALSRFLNGINSKWNITLFHYRNHGHDVGKIVAGICVPPYENDEFQQFLKQLEYPYEEETDNIAYNLFLKK
jgi:threonine dehydratase